MYDINSINIHNNKAVALIMLGRYSEAIPLLERCMQVKEIDRLFKNLADAFFQIGIYEKAAYNY
jgi:tetratricopeptide (TPR) repeat protein